MVVRAGEWAGIALIEVLMELMMANEPSGVVEEAMAGEGDCFGEEERCDTDRFLPIAVGGQREVLSKIDRSTGGVEGLCKARLGILCGMRDPDSRLSLQT